MTLDFMILGAQKAATTSLHSALRRSSAVYMPAGESAFFEDPDYASRPWEAFRDVDGRDRLLGIKRPDSLCRPDIINRVTQHLPDARFIVVLREPTSRAVSAYFHLVRHAHLPVRPLDEGLRLAVHAHRVGGDPTLASVVRFGLYGQHLSQWFTRLPPERFLILGQSEVIDGLADAVRRCCTHLGVEPPPATAGVATSPENVGLYDEHALALYQVGHRLKTRPLPGGGDRRERRSWIPRAAGEGVVRLARWRAADVAAPRPSADLVDQLGEIYAADLAVLRTVAPASALDWAPQPGTPRAAP